MTFAKLGRGRFVRGVAVLAGGALGAQALNALSAPFLTRLYEPAEIGQLALFVAFVSVGSIALSLRYEQAIVVPREHGVAARLARIALALVVPMTLIVTAIMGVVAVLGVADYDTLPGWAPGVAAITMLAFGVTAVLRYWLIRMERFDIIAGVLLGQSLGRGVAQIGLGFFGFGVAGLLVGELVGRLTGTLRMLRTAGPGLLSALREPVAMPSHRIAAEYAHFPLAGVPSSLLNTLAFYVPTPLLAATYGLPAAGLFALVQRVLAIPLSVVGASVADALLGRISEHARSAPEQAQRLFRVTALGLLALAIPLGIAVVVFAPPAFGVVFGSEWRLAGTLAAVMAPWYVAALIVSPLSRVVVVYRGQVSKLIYDTLSLGLAVSTISLADRLELGPIEAVWYLSLGQALAYCVYLLILYRLVRRESRVPSL